MRTPLLFGFSVNRENNTIHVIRELEAARHQVWKAWTTAELLDQWWAPLPYRNQTHSIDFQQGGHWHYAMISPENETHWSRFDYKTIEKEKYYSGEDSFCDEKGNINNDFDQMHWEVYFGENDHLTTVDITITFTTLETLDKVIAMGFQEGFTTGLHQLDELLLSLN